MHFFIIFLSWTCIKAYISFFLSVSTAEMGPQRSAFCLSGMAGGSACPGGGVSWQARQQQAVLMGYEE